MSRYRPTGLMYIQRIYKVIGLGTPQRSPSPSRVSAAVRAHPPLDHTSHPPSGHPPLAVRQLQRFARRAWWRVERRRQGERRPMGCFTVTAVRPPAVPKELSNSSPAVRVAGKPPSKWLFNRAKRCSCRGGGWREGSAAGRRSKAAFHPPSGYPPSGYPDYPPSGYPPSGWRKGSAVRVGQGGGKEAPPGWRE